MAKQSKGKMAGTRQTLVQYDQALPEIEGRKPHLPPTSYLEKDGKGGYRIVPGRRPSKLLLIPVSGQKWITGETTTTPGHRRHQNTF